MPVELTSENFTEITEGKVALLDFWASWCGPCRGMKPKIEELAEEFADDGEVVIATVNCDEEDGLARRFEVRGLPAFVLYKNDAVQSILLGVQTKKELANMILDNK